MMNVKYDGATFAAAILVAQIFGPSFASPTLAATALSVKTHIVEIGVDVDDALKSYPGLFDNCVAEGKTYAATRRIMTTRRRFATARHGLTIAATSSARR